MMVTWLLRAATRAKLCCYSCDVPAFRRAGKGPFNRTRSIQQEFPSSGAERHREYA